MGIEENGEGSACSSMPISFYNAMDPIQSLQLPLDPYSGGLADHVGQKNLSFLIHRRFLGAGSRWWQTAELRIQFVSMARGN